MRRRSRRGLIAAAVLAASLPLTAATTPAELDPQQLRAVTDEYLFEQNLDQFAATRQQAPHATQLDWSSDGCSSAPEQPLGFDFTTSCQRHDFGYRNYQIQDRFSEDNRESIDRNFRSDMTSTCEANLSCHATAQVYYWAVREFGGMATSTSDAVERAKIQPTYDDNGKLIQLRAVDDAGRSVTFPVP